MKFYAKYPFLDGAKAIVKEKKIDVDMLLTDMAYEPSRARGKERVAEAVEKGYVEDLPMAREADQLVEILSYPIARMMVSCAGDRFLIGRYALGEAMLLEKRLIGETDENIGEIARELAVEFEKRGDEYMIHFTAYLTATSSIRAKEWKLVNQEIFDGMVKISKEKLARVLRQRLNDKIASELPGSVTDSMISVLGQIAGEFSGALEAKRKEFAEGELGPVEEAAFPPCMRTILSMMRAGENVPHTGRFAITAFLHTIGMTGDRIMELFSTAPDFDPSKSEYQVRHIVGEISGTEYTPPECSTMKSYGICYNPDDFCQREWMTHPLKYYRYSNRRKFRSSKRAPSPDKTLKGGDGGRNDEDREHKVEKGKGKAK